VPTDSRRDAAASLGKLAISRGRAVGIVEVGLQRTVAAIRSADAVGGPRLGGIDEAGDLFRLKALRRDLIDPMIAAHATAQRKPPVGIPARLYGFTLRPATNSETRAAQR
jgi:hypothetical protein